MQYTIGNWTVKSLTTDSTSTAKTISIADLNYGADFSASVSSAKDARLVNKTTASVRPQETVRFGRETVANVYNGTNINRAYQDVVKEGYRTLNEVSFVLSAVNSVSGDEIQLPFRGWICLQIPQSDLIGEDAIDYLLKRTIACAFAHGDDGADLIIDEYRGDFNPVA